MNSSAADTAAAKIRPYRPIPGFGLTMGLTVLWLSLLALLPLSVVILHAATMPFSPFWDTVISERALSSYGLSFGGALIAAVLNCVFGLPVAWVLVRYRFFGRRFMDTLIDLPFAIPTAVAGIALTAVWGTGGVIGDKLSGIGLTAAYTRSGVVIAMMFVGFPFVVRTLQPVLEKLDPELEEAAAVLGADRFRTFRQILFPHMTGAMVTGFALSFARALGEYGSIVFISGNMPFSTEITPLLIMTQLEQFNYAGATALAVVMLGSSIAILVLINGLQWRRENRHRHLFGAIPKASLSRRTL